MDPRAPGGEPGTLTPVKGLLTVFKGFAALAKRMWRPACGEPEGLTTHTYSLLRSSMLLSKNVMIKEVPAAA